MSITEHFLRFSTRNAIDSKALWNHLISLNADCVRMTGSEGFVYKQAVDSLLLIIMVVNT